MSETNPFQDLIRRVRAGDATAAQELVRRYESKVRRVVRIRLDSGLQQQFDSMDICQSVLASFFVRASLGQHELETPEQVMNLLASMARHKLLQAANRQRRAPSSPPANQELLDETRRRLTDEERRLLELRDQGRDWSEIAAEVGGTPEALRNRLTRAIDRVAQEMGLADAGG